MPAEHALRTYQSKFPLYDKYLGFLAREIQGSGIVIDIGANVGDTTALIYQYCTNDILAIEPDAVYFSYLCNNIEALKLGSRVRPVNAAVGGGSLISLEKTAGTAKPKSVDEANKELGNIRTELLENIVKQAGYRDRPIELIKVDTDGFDYEVLSSSLDTIEKDRPIIFWENTVDNAEQLDLSNTLLKSLRNIGYTSFAVFDNFGTLITGECKGEFVSTLNQYLHLQSTGPQRAIYYTDVLAWMPEHKNSVKRSIDGFKRFSLES